VKKPRQQKRNRSQIKWMEINGFLLIWLNNLNFKQLPNVEIQLRKEEICFSENFNKYHHEGFS